MTALGIVFLIGVTITLISKGVFKTMVWVITRLWKVMFFLVLLPGKIIVWVTVFFKKN